MKADLAIYINMLGVPGQYKSVALMLDYKLDFSCCANKDSFHRDGHIYPCIRVWASSYRYSAKSLRCYTSARMHIGMLDHASTYSYSYDVGVATVQCMCF